ncbi:nucleotide exchange factor GrpE [Labrys monachus]|uniref:Protein GrpE n=1 Tax=Labrys monachus TaxID=217067 RepID=A0ABU0FMH6_9HYPH|nr:nucleotide exchange factor GrpE [Labrys monachus]MDQ0395814.1 molecular chaperone GrpE [Labrys monachus]
MTNKTTPHAEAADAAIEAEATASAEARAAAGNNPSSDAKADVGANDGAFEVLTKLQAENAELKDRLLRTLAEVENVRRRGEREVNDTRLYAIAKFAGDMLGVADNMGRALATIPAEARATGDATIKALVEGAELTEREMLRALEKHGVKKIDPKGERFDPNFHQAMFEVPDPSVPNGTVAQVVQVGYSIGSRVLRPAMVGVARGGPKAAAPEAEKQG